MSIALKKNSQSLKRRINNRRGETESRRPAEWHWLQANLTAKMQMQRRRFVLNNPPPSRLCAIHLHRRRCAGHHAFRL
jgi:hypothetical protein